MWFGGHWPSVFLSQAHPSACSGDGTLKTTFQTLPDGFLMGPAHLEKGWEGGMEKGHLSCCLKLLSASSWNCGWSQPPDSLSTSKSASLCPLPCTSMYQTCTVSFDTVDWCLDCLQSLSQVGGLQLEFVIRQLSTAMGPPPIPLSWWSGMPLGPLGSWSISRRHPQCIVTWGQNTVLWHHWVLSLPEADPFCVQTTEASVSRASREKLVRFQPRAGGDSTAPHIQPFPLNPFTQKP